MRKQIFLTEPIILLSLRVSLLPYSNGAYALTETDEVVFEMILLSCLFIPHTPAWNELASFRLHKAGERMQCKTNRAASPYVVELHEEKMKQVWFTITGVISVKLVTDM